MKKYACRLPMLSIEDRQFQSYPTEVVYLCSEADAVIAEMEREIEGAKALFKEAQKSAFAFRDKSITKDKTIALMERAIRDVLAHRRSDPDGNYVMWVGETCFHLCQNALDACPKTGT